MLLLTGLLALPGACGDAAEPAGQAPAGEDRPAPSVSEEEAEALRALGYVAGTEPAAARTGVLVHDPERAYRGINLVVPGHAPEAALLDMEGRVLHRWRYDASLHYPIEPARNYWVQVRVLPDGSLVGIVDPHGIVKIDRNSQLVWATDASSRAHHDLHVTDDGSIYALGKRLAPLPDIHPTKTIIQDLVVVFDADGRKQREISILDAFRSSPFAEEVLAGVRERTDRKGPRWLPPKARDEYAEDFHANTIEVLDGSLSHVSPVLRKGNILLCSLRQRNVFVIDGETESVVWSWAGPWHNIHQPVVLETGGLLLFHNGDVNKVGRADLISSVLEFDFRTREETWRYEGRSDEPGTQFASWCCGGVQRLPNGNTLVNASAEGRAIEVTPGGDVVWEYVTPQTIGDDKIATLFQFDRLPPDTLDWLDAPASGASGR